LKVGFACGLAAIALAVSITSVSAQSAPDSDAASLDWTLLEAMQRAYDRVRDGDDYARRDAAFKALDAVAAFQGLTIPQFDSKLRGPRPVPTPGGSRADVTVDGEEIPLGASCGLSLTVPCVTGDLARARREEAAAQGVLIDTWDAEQLPTAIYQRV
jgi:hypothetical protein